MNNNFGTPFIKKFEDNGFYYVYDVNTNQVVEIEKNIYDIIDEYDERNPNGAALKFNGIYESSDLLRSIREIENAKTKHGLFSSFRPELVAMGLRSAKKTEELYSRGLEHLLLEVETGCNLNCAYCSTSGKYAAHTAGDSRMTPGTCIKAVDFFCERTGDIKQPRISFYGGEPLLRFDLIEQVVGHVKKNYKNKKYTFGLTTNGTLLDKRCINLFIENDFSLLVSLDGPAAVHDRYRRFKNGRGTFKRLMKNLVTLQTYNSDYFSRRVSISSVLSPPFDKIDEVLDFFSNSETIREIKGKIRSSLVNVRKTTFFEDFGLAESLKEYPEIREKLLIRVKNAILKNRLLDLTIENKKTINILYNIARRAHTEIRDIIPPLGMCHMGMRRLFVRAGGDFFACERVERDDDIGNLDRGFDFEKMAGYYRKLEVVLADCKNCWAMLHCERCWATIGKLDEFTGEKKEKFCTYSKKTIEEAFMLCIRLLRESPDSLKVFKNEAYV